MPQTSASCPDAAARPSSIASTGGAVGDAPIRRSAACSCPWISLVALAAFVFALAPDSAKAQASEVPPTATLWLTPATIDESGVANSSAVTATLDRNATDDVTLTISAIPGPDTANGHYRLVGSTLTITAGSKASTGSVRIVAVDDTTDSPNKTVSVSASVTNGTATGPAAKTLTITDDEDTPTVKLALASPSIDENGGATRVSATQSRASSRVTTVTVIANAELYTVGSPATLTIPAGATESAGSVLITAVDDSIDNLADRSGEVTGTASNSHGVDTTAGPVTLTLVDDEVPPMVTLVLASSTIPEKDGSTTVTATLDKASPEDIVLTVSAKAVSPGEAGDFMLTGSTLTIEKGKTASTGTVTIAAVNNDAFSPDTMVTVSATAMGGGVADPTARTLTILNDESGLSIDSPRISEGEASGGVAPLVFTVTLAPVSTDVVTVKYADTGKGDATADTDYLFRAGMLTFMPGETSKTIDVTVRDDTEVEPDETVVLALSDPTGGALLGTDTGTGTIVNDDSRITAMPGEAATLYRLAGQTVAVTSAQRIPAGVSVGLPSTLAQNVGLRFLTVDHQVPLENPRYSLGQAGARTLVDIDVTPVPAGGVDVCLPVTERMLRESAGQPLRLLRHDGDGWEALANPRTVAQRERRWVCASGVTAFSPFAVAYAKAVTKADSELLLGAVARTLASDAVDMLSGRFEGLRDSGSRMTLAGQALSLTPQGAQHATDRSAWHRFHASPARWQGDPRRDATTTSVSTQDLLTRSSFVLSLDDDSEEGGQAVSALTLWGQGSMSGFSGSPEAGFDMDGTLGSGWLGGDYQVDSALLVGMAVATSAGTVEHVSTNTLAAETDVRISHVLPYAHWQSESGLELWGFLGAGKGETTSRVDDGDGQTSYLTSWMGAVGGRQELVRWGGGDLAARVDAFSVALRSEESANQSAAYGHAKRVRFLVEGRTDWSQAASSRITSRLVLGGRWDSGSADSGTRMEVGGGLAWVEAAAGLRVELRGRYLLGHASDEFEDWGAGLDVHFGPGTDGRGLALSLSPTLGNATGGAGSFHSGTELTDLAVSDNRRAGGMEAELAYGVAGFGDAGTVTPYSGLTLDGKDAARYRLGSRVALGSSFKLTVESNRTERAGEPDSHGVSAQLGLRW